jgi:hypothetical protein
MNRHNLQNALETANMTGSGKAIYDQANAAHVLGWGTSAPASGFVPGAIYIDTDTTEAYKNTGTATSCTWTAITDALDADGYLPLTGGTMAGTLVSLGIQQKYNVVASATNVTITAAMLNGIVEVTGTTASNLNLPAVASCPAGTWITFIKNGASGALTIEPNSSETIDGASNDATMDADNDTITIVSSGTEWFTIAERIAP